MSHDKDVKASICDIMLDQPVKVRAHQPIHIGVRFTVGEEFFCSTMFGYGGNNYERKIQENEKGAFIIAESEMCTKYETEVEFGQIPRIFYY